MSKIFLFDMFGVEKKINILGKEKYNTYLSSIFSILLIILLILKFIKLISNIYTKNSYTVKTTFISDPDLVVSIKDFQFAICSTNPDYSKIIEWDKNFTLHFANYDLEMDQDKINDISYNCNKDDYPLFFKTVNTKLDFKKCLCYSVKDDNIELEQRNEINGRNYAVILNKTESGSNKTLNMLFYYIDNYFDYDKDKPFNSVINYFGMIISSSKYTYQEMYFNKLIYIDDAFDYELFQTRGTNNSIYSVSEKNFINQIDPDETFKNMVWACNLKCNNKIIKNEITLYSIDIIYAAFGGFYQLFQSLFSFICTSYNEKCLDDSVLNYFKNDFKNLRKSYISLSSIRNNQDHSKISNNNKLLFSGRHNIKRHDKIEIKFKNHIIKENISKIYDYINFIKIHSDINILKKILLCDNDNNTLFDIASYYNIYGVIKDDNLNFKYDRFISNNLQILLNQEEFEI